MRSDPLAGTAAPARCWLLVEHPGPWGIDAWASSGIAKDVRRELSKAVPAVGARIILVRRPGRRQRLAARSWAVARGGVGGRVTWGGWERDEDLLESLPVLFDDGETARQDEGAGDDRLLLVCTHGRHDLCCAVRGRPVGLALQERWPRETWECSHVGGDRFAANVVVLPDGAYYGNLDASSAVEVVQEHLRGRVVAEHLRGFSGAAPPVQAAVAEAHRRYGPAPVDAFSAKGLRRLGDARWEVELDGPEPHRARSGAAAGPSSLLVTVDAATAEPATLTCRAASPTAATVHRVVALREAG